jgi:cold shock CspA family protein
MALPIDLTFKHIEPSEAIRSAIEEYAQKLPEFYPGLLRCRVVVSAPHRRHRKGKLFELRLELDVPGNNIVVNRRPGDMFAHQDVYVAIRDAFKAAERRLKEYRAKIDQEVKTHEIPPHGRITKLFREQGYAFVETPDGREYYVHRNSVLNNAFDRLEIGSEVRFTPERGEKGPQASSVHLIGKHRLGEFVEPKK